MTENNQKFRNEDSNSTAAIQTQGKYSCKACGNTLDARPPDDVHRFSSVYPCWKFDWIERSYRCSSCSKSTTLYWHPEVHRHHDYATVEEMERKMGKDNLGDHPEYVRRMAGY